jgi:hypothetical protein
MKIREDFTKLRESPPVREPHGPGNRPSSDGRSTILLIAHAFITIFNHAAMKQECFSRRLRGRLIKNSWSGAQGSVRPPQTPPASGLCHLQSS